MPVPGLAPFSGAQFAALEPSWAGIQSADQLRVLLILGALFNRRLFISDTQLGDNPYLMAEYASHHYSNLNLYSLLTGLIKQGAVVTALRDGTYLPKEDRLVRCESLRAVVSSWNAQGIPGAWVVPQGQPTRTEMVREIDGFMSRGQAPFLRYDYRAVKADFIAEVRRASDPGGVLATQVAAMATDVRRAYDEVLRREWFSHSDVFDVLQRGGYRAGDPLAQLHGLLDEASYAHWHQGKLLGSDWQLGSGWRPEEILRGDAPPSELSVPDPDQPSVRSPLELERLADRVIEGPGFDLLATLTAPQIMELRSGAVEFFDLQEMSLRRPSDDIASALLDSAADYWDAICSRLRTTHPHLARRRTKVALYLRRRAPRLEGIAENVVSLGLSTVARALLDVIPGVRSLDSDTKDDIASHVGLEFIFFGESEGMAALKRAFPARTWIAPDNRVSEGGSA